MGLQTERDESAVLEIPDAGSLCPNCEFARLIREGMQVFCPLCNYGIVKCT